MKMNASVPTLDHSRYFLVRKKTRKISEVDLGILLADFDNIMYRLLILCVCLQVIESRQVNAPHPLPEDVFSDTTRYRDVTIIRNRNT